MLVEKGEKLVFDTLIAYLRANVDAAYLVGALCLWALIFPDYTGIHFDGKFKTLSPTERIIVRAGAGFMLLCLLLVKFVIE